MKRIRQVSIGISFLAFMLLSLQSAIAQESNTLRTNQLKNTLPGFLNQKYEVGSVYFKDGSVVNALLNFNRLTNQVYFISKNNETMVLANPEKVYMVSIAKDTLFIDGTIVFRKISEYGAAPNLFARQEIKYVGKENVGPYGSYSEVSTVNAASTYSTDDQITKYLNLDENSLYKVTNFYYLNDGANNFYPVKKKHLKKIFPQHEKEINDFIKTEKIDLDKKDDLMKLLQYHRSL